MTDTLAEVPECRHGVKEDCPACAQETIGDLMKALEEMPDWCARMRTNIGAVDGYDYRSGEEAGIRTVEIEIRRRLAAFKAHRSRRL